MTIKHTKLPWWMASTDQIIEIRGQAEQGAHHVTIAEIHGNDILYPSRRVDAELILKAVNSYDSTLEALEAVYALISTDDWNQDRIENLGEIVETAITRAKELTS